MSDTTYADPPPQAESALTPDQPWPGLAPYSEADRIYFHGRRAETEELLRMIPRDPIALLIGESGVGKTSLIHASLVPALAEGEYLPVVVRLDWWSAGTVAASAGEGSAANLANPLISQVTAAVAAAAKVRGVSGPTAVEGDSLWEYFHRSGHRWWSPRQRVVTPVIIIDQFEQAFFAGRDTATASRNTDRLIEAISQLVSNRPPPKVVARIEQDAKSDSEFVFDTVPVRVLLVMREDALGELAAYRQLFPTLRRSEMRLQPFSLSRARDTLTRAAAQKNLFAEDAVDQVVKFLAQGRVHAVEILPAHLSVLGQALAAERVRRGGGQITADFLSVRPGRILHDFALAATSDLPPDAITLLEEQLVDPAGHPRTMSYRDAQARSGIPREALETMLQRRLLRLEGSSETPHIALGHGLLVDALKETRIERAFNTREKTAVIASAQAQASAAVASHASQRSRIREAVAWTLACIFGLVSVLAIVLRPDKDETLLADAAPQPTPETRSTPEPAESATPKVHISPSAVASSTIQPPPPVAPAASSTPVPSPPVPAVPTPEPATSKIQPTPEPQPNRPAGSPISPTPPVPPVPPELQSTLPTPADRAALPAEELIANMEREKAAERQRFLEAAERRKQEKEAAAREAARETERRRSEENTERSRNAAAPARANAPKPDPSSPRPETRTKRPVGIGGN